MIDIYDVAARYFEKTEGALDFAHMTDEVTIQYFQREDSILYGIDEAVALIKRHYPAAKVMALRDGMRISPWESVMHVTAPLFEVVVTESAALGVMARGTRVATNMRRIVDAAGSKPVLFMGDRFDRPECQESDGAAAIIGGASAVCTNAMGRRLGYQSQGTMPHALIAACGGDVVKACRVMKDAYPGEPVSALVDFNNDCVGDSLKCLEAFGKDLYSVRLDTSGNMLDKSLERYTGTIYHQSYCGVNVVLVDNVRNALDANGGQHVKIVVSGGFTPEKIAMFEREGTPVDMYGVGSSIIKNGPDFTADVVMLNGKPMAKVGREFRPNPRLKEI